MKYIPIIGLEIHAELKTKTKMFCDSLNDPDEKHPNINVCPICISHPGTLPVINQEAVKKVIIAGLALNCKIAEDTFFERKNYFYPDLPKGYQISQYQKPLCYDGWFDMPRANRLQTTADSEALTGGSWLAVDPKRIRITRIHLEEDAGRLYHLPDKDYSLVDYNRAGVPLIELVTEPDFESGQEVKKFAEELQLMWRYLGVSDADMEKGQMRVEVNISLMEIRNGRLDVGRDKQLEVGQNISHLSSLTSHLSKLGTKVEIKNINSIKFAVDAVDYEIKRQTELLEAGEKIKQETRGWDEFKKQSFSQRSKEEAHDYRYFPEPDLPPLRVVNSKSKTLNPKQIQNAKFQIQNEPFIIEEIRSELLELPQQRRERFKKQYNLPDRDIEVFIVNKPLGDYFEHVASELLSFDHVKLRHVASKLDPEHETRLLKLAANYIITELKRMCEEVSAEPADTKITPEIFADLIVRVFHSEVSSSGAQTVLKEMFATGRAPGEIIKEKNLEQVSSVEELDLAVEKVIADNQKAVADFKAGKEASLKFLVGMAMKETKGKANPQVVEEILRNMLK